MRLWATPSDQSKSHLFPPPKLLPDIVAASKGNETIQKEGKGEGGEEDPE